MSYQQIGPLPWTAEDTVLHYWPMLCQDPASTPDPPALVRPSENLVLPATWLPSGRMQQIRELQATLDSLLKEPHSYASKRVEIDSHGLRQAEAGIVSARAEMRELTIFEYFSPQGSALTKKLELEGTLKRMFETRLTLAQNLKAEVVKLEQSILNGEVAEVEQIVRAVHANSLWRRSLPEASEEATRLAAAFRALKSTPLK